ncbi:uncharacterized protein LOC134285296 [Aedes albopictus]|uniref:CCHC-type domain-containing protein n=1 Tax=Aedes albopictus TaxID=7160 RepID=A0ABM1YF18_AEDAL
MAERMNKSELMVWLREHNVEFPISATVRHLRALYESQPRGKEVPECSNDGDSTTDEEEEQLDAEIRVLEKRKRIADLRRELAETEVLPNKQPDFQDVKHTVPKFANSDFYNANKWITDFERACDAINGDDLFKLKCIRRMMEPGTEAEWVLRIDKSTTYKQFRDHFLENFGHVYSVAEVIDKLRKTPFVPGKSSVMGYILQMQEIASRANIDEAQTVQLIIDGFRDRSANIAVLYPANNIGQLKQLARRYSHLREVNSVPSPTASAKTKITRATALPVKPSDYVLRCYNCSGTGHLSVDCLKPRREIGSCFRCGSMQHKLKDCPKPAPRNQDRVALVEEFVRRQPKEPTVEDDLAGALSEINMVSVAFLSDENVQPFIKFLSVFDTGSPINLIQRSSVPTTLLPTREVFSGNRSVGGFPLCCYGIVYVP